MKKLNGQQALDTSVLSLVHDDTGAQVALCFRRFFAHQVAHTRTVALDFTAASHRKTFFGAGMRLHLWHNKNVDFENGAQRYIYFPNGQIKKQKFRLKKESAYLCPDVVYISTPEPTNIHSFVQF